MCGEWRVYVCMGGGYVFMYKRPDITMLAEQTKKVTWVVVVPYYDVVLKQCYNVFRINLRSIFLFL